VKSQGAELGRSDPAEWAAALARLDVASPPTDMQPDRWRQLVEDARWLADRHARSAAALGWTASDLFGIGHSPGWGGLADRLEGARRATFTDGVAHWRSDELDGWLWRRSLRRMPAMWELVE